ncbi:MAG: LuxR C-terminal-related transcriptional regulator [Thermomicrobiales bacterium]
MPRSPDLPHLPEPLTRFFGRDQDIAEASARLRSGQTRLLSLTGAGGVGKSRLALQIAAKLHDQLADGVVVVPLSAVSDAGLVLSSIMLAAGIEGEIDADPASLLRRRLAQQELLLLLDNFEQVTAACPALGDLLAACPNVRALVTSRVPLHLAGEHVLAVAPFPVPDIPAHPDADLPALAATEAIALFCDRARAVCPTFALTASNVRDVATICRRCDGLPLALELAAARMRLLAPNDLAVRLEQRLPLLTDGRRDQPDRLRTMRHAIAWSYDLLNADQRRLFRQLSVFAGGFGISAVEHVAAPAPGALAVDLLGDLIDASLIQRIAGPGEMARFSMLETIREYGLEQLAAAGEEDAARDVQVAWCIGFAEDAGSRLAGPDHLLWWHRLEAEVANIRQAHAWLFLRQDAERALRLGSALGWFWAVAGYYGEGRALYRQLAAMPAAPHYPALLAQVLSAAGNLEHWLDNIDVAESLYQRQLALSRSIPDQEGVVSALRALGSIAIDRADLDAAEGCLTEATALAPAGSAWDTAAIANLLGIVAFGRGDYHAAAHAFEAAIRGWHAIDDTGHVGAARVNLARAALASGKLREAAETLGQVLEVIQPEVGDDMITSDCLEVAGGIARATGDARDGLHLLAAANAMVHRMGVKRRPPFADFAQQQATTARLRLNRREAAEAWQAGGTLTLEAALSLTRLAVAAGSTMPLATSEDGLGLASLTVREEEVLRLVASGQSDKEIAQVLGIARFTVSNHVSNIRAKLSAPSRAALAAVAVRNGLA